MIVYTIVSKSHAYQLNFENKYFRVYNETNETINYYPIILPLFLILFTRRFILVRWVQVFNEDRSFQILNVHNCFFWVFPGSCLSLQVFLNMVQMYSAEFKSRLHVSSFFVQSVQTLSILAFISMNPELRNNGNLRSNFSIQFNSFQKHTRSLNCCFSSIMFEPKTLSGFSKHPPTDFTVHAHAGFIREDNLSQHPTFYRAKLFSKTIWKKIGKKVRIVRSFDNVSKNMFQKYLAQANVFFGVYWWKL